MAASASPVAAMMPKTSKTKRKSKKKVNGRPEEEQQTALTNGSIDQIDPDAQDEADAENDQVDSSNQAIADTTSPISAEPNSVTSIPSTRSATGKPGEDAQDATTSNEDRSDDSPSSDAVVRLEHMQQQRDQLRLEVTELRQQLESLQECSSDDETAALRIELEQTRHGKDQAETQYRNLLSKVSGIRAQLGDRLKADAEELDRARGRIEALENERAEAENETETLKQSVNDLTTQVEAQSSEIASLRDRTNLSTSNWVKERDELLGRESYLREEYEIAKQAMQDWEILATEERSRREALEERSQELEDQLASHRSAHGRVKDELDTQNNAVDGLQRALRDLQEERKRELRDMVEQSQAQLNELRTQSKTAEQTAAELKQQLETAQKELERALPYEKEVREKNLLIGKLRHEAVTLNDHLVKALRFLKRGNPEDNVDRHLVTNHLLQFLALDRSDAKKFQVLQLIAALLGWTEEQREQAGLLRQGSISGTGSLKLPVSPFRRTPSTPTLTADLMPETPSHASKETLAELWSEFLEREAETGARSRTGSVATALRSPSISGVTSPLGGRSEWGGTIEMGKTRRKESIASINTNKG